VPLAVCVIAFVPIEARNRLFVHLFTMHECTYSCNGVLAAIRGEHEVPSGGDQGAGNALEIHHRAEKTVVRTVDDVKYLNRLSNPLFVLGRRVNGGGTSDTLRCPRRPPLVQVPPGLALGGSMSRITCRYFLHFVDRF